MSALDKVKLSDKLTDDQIAHIGDILELEDNWNNNGAEAFDPQFVQKAIDFIDSFEEGMNGFLIFPTAIPTIQIEREYEFMHYELYLEFNLHPDDDRIHVLGCIGKRFAQCDYTIGLDKEKYFKVYEMFEHGDFEFLKEIVSVKE